MRAGVGPNRYAYNGHDPINGMDPTGHQSLGQSSARSYIRKETYSAASAMYVFEKDVGDAVSSAASMAVEMSPIGAARNIKNGVESEDGWRIAWGLAELVPWSKAAGKAYNAYRATKSANNVVESVAPSLVQRLGPKDVDPLHHNANVLVRDSSGNVVAHRRFASGNMTLEVQALGFPKNTLASHTEARAVRTMKLEPGSRMVITGKNPPCKVYRDAMNQSATESGATIRYQWRQGGGTLIWTAKPKGQ